MRSIQSQQFLFHSVFHKSQKLSYAYLEFFSMLDAIIVWKNDATGYKVCWWIHNNSKWDVVFMYFEKVFDEFEHRKSFIKILYAWIHQFFVHEFMCKNFEHYNRCFNDKINSWAHWCTALNVVFRRVRRCIFQNTHYMRKKIKVRCKQSCVFRSLERSFVPPSSRYFQCNHIG